MSVLLLHRWGETEPVTLEFVGWKDSNRRCFFIRDENGEAREVKLVLPGRDNYSYAPDAIPDMPPTAIVRAAIHVPPCRGSKSEADELRTEKSNAWSVAEVFSPWELFTPHVLYLDKSDDAELLKRLQHEKRRLSAEYEARLAAIEKSRMPAKAMKQERRQLEDAFTFLRSTDTDLQAKRVAVPLREVTLDDVKKGWGGVRDAYLREWWAKQYGFNLEKIVADAQALRRWLTRIASNAKIVTFDARTRTQEISYGFKISEVEWQIREAAVRYEIRFADERTFWLDDIVQVSLSDVDSLQAFARLEEAMPTAKRRITEQDILDRLKNRDGEPISPRWLKTLCQRAGVPCPPTTQGQLEAVVAQQNRQNSRQKKKLVEHNKANTGPRLK